MKNYITTKSRHLRFFNNVCFLVIPVIMVSTSSCGRFLEIAPPGNELGADAVFNDGATANAAIAGVYHNMSISTTHFASGGLSSVNYLCALLSDDFVYHLADVNDTEFYIGDISARNLKVQQIWESAYQTIYQANSILEGLSSATGIPPTSVNQLRGEALFIRAFCYFYLVNCFGDIPLTVSVQYQGNAIAERESTASVYQRITSDLNEAITLLADDYSTSGGERVRVNRWAATALLARVYLFLEDWESAESMASEIIANDALFGLDEVDGVFLKNSREAIWQLLPVGVSGSTSVGAFAIPLPFQIWISLSASLMAEFEEGDSRKDRWVSNAIAVNGNRFNYVYKYKLRTLPAGVPKEEYTMVLRLAEQYLIRAECRIRLNEFDGALDDLNRIRNRAGVGEFRPEAPSQELLMGELMKERRIELFYEWGHRWSDLKRWGKLDAAMAIAKPNWQDRSVLFPLPEGELTTNPKLVQNAGY